MIRRRDLLLGAAGLAGGGAALVGEQRLVHATALYPGREQGHWLRDAHSLPEPKETQHAEVLIAGSGVAGLTAAWQLRRRGFRDVVMLSGPERFGNTAGGEDGELRFPTGAHYLPLPSQESWHVREMLAEFGIIQKDPFSERPTYDERILVHAPAERVLFRGAWQEGYLPTEGVSSAELADHERFFTLIENYTAARGSDGRRAFAVPVMHSSSDAAWRALDALTFKVWLDRSGFTAPSLLWYLNYCCRDDYGRSYDEISAWAGLHYFCARDGLAANAERGAVLTWPQGLAAVSQLLENQLQEDMVQPGFVARLRSTDAGVEALVLEPHGSGMRAYRITARQVIAAMPLFITQRIYPECVRLGFQAARDLPAYAPWLVSNFLLRAFPAEQPGAPLSWDNVIYRQPGLGYVVSTHQDLRLSRPERAAFTAYHALSDQPVEQARQWLQQASVAQLNALASRDLRAAYGWRLPLCVERIEHTVRAHAMAVPTPGFLSRPGRLALQSAPGPIHFAHSDLSGLSLFEEAAWWGYRAAVRAVAAR